MDFKKEYPEAIDQIEFIKKNDPELFKEIEAKYHEGIFHTEKANGKLHAGMMAKAKTELLSAEGVEETMMLPVGEGAVDETIVLKAMRPVFAIRDNTVAFDEENTDAERWKTRLEQKRALLDELIPKVGRIEVSNNAEFSWVGTGWLIDEDIIVTNRHVADIFSVNGSGFKFKVGYPSGSQGSSVDFLEEDKRSASLVFDIDRVLWMSENVEGVPDVAFMLIRKNKASKGLPRPIALAAPEGEGEMVVTIGYPARDPRIPDQELVLKIFGNIYDKKRLAPGQITAVDAGTIQHDCSTTGGVSGGAVISLKTGKAIGLHYGGLYLKGNYAVSALVLMDLLQKLKAGQLPGMEAAERTEEPVNILSRPEPAPGNTQKVSFEFNIPVKVTVEIGLPAFPSAQGDPATAALQLVQTAGDEVLSFTEALDQARSMLTGKPGIIAVYGGYRFKNGWITGEQAIVVDVQQKLTLPQLRNEGLPLIPSVFGGIGTDVRTATIGDQLDFIGVMMPELEAVPKAGVYREPPNLKLTRVRERMQAIFHVSPDSGFPNLKAFLERIETRLTATIYEWEAQHISDAVYDAISAAEGRLKMVTQKAGTELAVAEMKERLGDRFEHTFASVGTGKIVPTAYHIKVASRDGKEFWLSSGNWKDSNQADIDPAGDHSTSIKPLREHNREWNVIIRNNKLAKLFQEYIDWDFDEALRVPLDEAVIPEMFLLIPELPQALAESRPIARYFEPLAVDKELDVQPLLTPDHNAGGQHMFLQQATELIRSAKTSIDIQNQSFSLLAENDQEYERFFNTLLQQQNKGVAIRIIFRDPREFSRVKGEENLKKQLERLKAFGLDTDNMKVQQKCHTKAIIVDSDDPGNAAVLFGSHNLTTSGALFNRDASLLIRDAEVAGYFQQIFNFDWDVLAVQKIEESPGGVQVTSEKAPVPAGFRKVRISQLLSES